MVTKYEYIYECLDCGVKDVKRIPVSKPWRCRDCAEKYSKEIRALQLKGVTAKRHVLKERGNACQKCGIKEGKMNVHHIVPVFAGGTHDRDNLIVLCLKCHKAEHHSGTSITDAVEDIDTGLTGMIIRPSMERRGRKK